MCEGNVGVEYVSATGVVWKNHEFKWMKFDLKIRGKEWKWYVCVAELNFKHSNTILILDIIERVYDLFVE